MHVILFMSLSSVRNATLGAIVLSWILSYNRDYDKILKYLEITVEQAS